MSLLIEPREKYLLLAFISDNIGDDDLDKLESYVSSSGEKANYVVVDFSSITIVDTEKLLHIEELLQQIITVYGLIVFANNNEKINTDLSATFNDPDLLILPTVDEAVDYIFMDEIENDLGGDG